MLYRHLPPKVRLWYRILALPIALLLGLLIPGPLGEVFLGLAGALGAVYLLTLGLLLTITVHELGQVFGGSLVGFEFKHMKVGWIEVRRTDGKTSFYITDLCSGRSEAVGMMPRDGSKSKASAYRVMAFTGAITSLSYFGVALAVALTSNLNFRLSADTWAVVVSWIFLLVLLIPSSLAVFVYLMPVKSGVESGVSQLWRAAKDPDYGDQMATTFEFQQVVHEGQRACDWDEELLARLKSHASSALYRGFGDLRYYYRNLDLKQFGEASQSIEEAFENVRLLKPTRSGGQTTIFLEAAFSRAFISNDAEGAEAAFAAAEKTHYKCPHLKLRALAAIDMVHGRLVRAMSNIEASRAELHKANSIITPNIQAEFDWLDWMEERIEARTPKFLV